MNQNLSAAIGIMGGFAIVGIIVVSYLHLSSSETSNRWLSFFSWGVILITTLYWFVVTSRKKTRPQAMKALKSISTSSLGLIKWHLKWQLWILLVVLIFTGIILLLARL